MSKGKGKFLKGFLLGSAVGTAVGMMFAPKSGREFREDLTEETDRIVNKAKSEFNDAREAAVNSFESSKDSFMNKTQESKDKPDPIYSTAGDMASDPEADKNRAQEPDKAETAKSPEPEKKPKRRGRPPKKKVDA